MASIEDVVIFNCRDETAVGQVQFFAQVASSNFACVKSWRSLGQNMFDASDAAHVLIDLESIIDACIHVKRGRLTSGHRATLDEKVKRLCSDSARRTVFCSKLCARFCS